MLHFSSRLLLLVNLLLFYWGCHIFVVAVIAFPGSADQQGQSQGYTEATGGDQYDPLAENDADDLDPDPKILVINATEGSRVNMVCDVESAAPDFGQAIWKKINGSLPAKASVQGAILDIPKIRLDDSGFYECRPTWADPTERPQTVAQIIVQPALMVMAALEMRRCFFPRVSPQNLTIEEGQPFNFQCTSTKPDFGVYWTRDSSPMSPYLTLSGGNLTSPTSQMNDSGEYQCSHHGKFSASVSVTLSILARRHLPSVIPLNLTVDEGQPLQFKCIATREGTNVEWSRINALMPDNVTVTDGYLFSNSARQNDTGEYQCGHVGQAGEEITTHLTVLPMKFPVIGNANMSVAGLIINESSIHLVIVNITEGEPFQVQCSSTRDGTDVEWTRENTSIPLCFERSGGLLIINSTDAQDAGEFFCGHKGRKMEKISLQLNFMPRKYPIIQFNDETVSVPSANVTVNEGEPYEFHCQYSTREDSDVQWILIASSAPLGYAAGSRLTSSAASKNDTGEYHCRHTESTKEISTISLTVLPLQYPVLGILGCARSSCSQFLVTTFSSNGSLYNLTVGEGQQISIHCNSTRENATVQWSQGAGSGHFKRTAEDSDSASVLPIDYLRPEDSGLYNCEHIGWKVEKSTIQLKVTRNHVISSSSVAENQPILHVTDDTNDAGPRASFSPNIAETVEVSGRQNVTTRFSLLPQTIFDNVSTSIPLEEFRSIGNGTSTESHLLNFTSPTAISPGENTGTTSPHTSTTDIVVAITDDVVTSSTSNPETTDELPTTSPLPTTMPPSLTLPALPGYVHINMTINDTEYERSRGDFLGSVPNNSSRFESREKFQDGATDISDDVVTSSTSDSETTDKGTQTTSPLTTTQPALTSPALPGYVRQNTTINDEEGERSREAILGSLSNHMSMFQSRQKFSAVPALANQNESGSSPQEDLNPPAAIVNRTTALKAFLAYATRREDEIKSRRLRLDRAAAERREKEDQIRRDHRRMEDNKRQYWNKQLLQFLSPLPT